MKVKIPFDDPLPETHLAIDAAIIAGKIVMEIYEKDFQSIFKNNKEPITEADIKSDKQIQNIIGPSGHPILSEEGYDDKQRLEHKRVWIIDPLDGTSDFVNKTGEFTIMLALVNKQKPILGVIYWPTHNALYLAQKDRGSFQLLNGKWTKLSISTISSLGKCRAVGSRHHLSKKEQSFLEYINVDQFTSKGSSLKVIDVASGYAELYFTMTDKIKQWDTCASYCLIKEAGGNITDMLGNDLIYNTETLNHQNGILVTNGFIHDQLIKCYKQFLNK